MPKKQKIDLNKEVRNVGLVLIALGVLHFILSGFLDPFWGALIIAVGIISIFYRSRNMLLVFGILLILVGILNMSSFALYPQEVSGGWGIFAIIQIIWGIQEINRFRKVKENPKYIVKEVKKKGFVWYGLRVGFWVIIGLWLISAVFGDDSMALTFIGVALSIFVFVVSVIHLTKYKNKAMAVFSLVISSLLVILFLIGFGIGLVGWDVAEEDIICYDFCSIQEDFNTYYFGYDYYDEDLVLQSSKEFGVKSCECYDVYDEILSTTLFTEDGLEVTDENINDFIESITIFEELDSEYFVYYELADTDYKRSSFFVKSDGLLDIFFVKSEGDYNRFMDGEDYNYYEDCVFTDIMNEEVSCYTSSGGMVVNNPGNYKISYSIT